MGIPFEDIAEAALGQLESLLLDLFPNGRKLGREFKVGSLRGERGESLGVNLDSGLWSDFATQQTGGNFIDLLAAARYRGDLGRAARDIADRLGIPMLPNGYDTTSAGHLPNGRSTEYRQVSPISAGQPNTGHQHVDDWQPWFPTPGTPPPEDKLRRASTIHEYTDTAGHIISYVLRFEATPTDKKRFAQLNYGTLNGETGWHYKGPPKPSPLYGLAKLPAFPTATVILVEGEKAADAAQKLLPAEDYISLTWSGGASNYDAADVEPLRGRKIILWPDADDAGRKAMQGLAQRLGNGQIIDTGGLDKGFDAADLGPDVEDPAAWLLARLPHAPSLTHDALGVWDAGDDNYLIPPRGWLLGTSFCRRFVSSLIADGGVGKTALRLAQLISLATGRSLTGEYVFLRCRVLMISLEDDTDELRRRVRAVMLHHNITPADLKGWLYLATPKGIKLAQIKETDRTPAPGEMLDMLNAFMWKYRPDVVTLDPFVKTHGMEENANTEVDYVCTLLTAMAIEHNCAIDIPHHTRKGITATPGDADRGRGASSMKDAARLVYTLTPMSPDEAQKYGATEQLRRSLVRLDKAKINIAPPDNNTRWFRLIGVNLNNPSPRYPSGDNVQTVEPWQPRGMCEGMDANTLTAVFDALTQTRHGPTRQAKQTPWAGIPLMTLAGRTETEAKKVLAAWIENEVLNQSVYTDDNRNTRKCLTVNQAKVSQIIAAPPRSDE